MAMACDNAVLSNSTETRLNLASNCVLEVSKKKQSHPAPHAQLCAPSRLSDTVAQKGNKDNINLLAKRVRTSATCVQQGMHIPDVPGPGSEHCWQPWSRRR
jgi:hypothetical protein